MLDKSARDFGATSTADEVLAGIDLAGRRVMITGVSAGLGVETARALSAHGAEVIGAARDLAKAERALREVGAQKVALLELDLADLKSVRAAADTLIAEGRMFDLVISNAGVMATPFSYTADGFETQFGTNHLGHFVLVNRMAPLIKNSGRVVSLASAGHRFSDIDLEDPNFERTAYDPFISYGRSKTANILFAVEFDRRHRNRGVRATAVHPGGVQTELSRYLSEEMRQQILGTINAQAVKDGKPAFQHKTIPQGAATSVWAGVVASADEVGGRYCADCRVVTNVTGEPLDVTSNGVRAYALDSEHAKALWAKSEEMVGERFPAE